jgi:hypothetical protein
MGLMIGQMDREIPKRLTRRDFEQLSELCNKSGDACLSPHPAARPTAKTLVEVLEGLT